LKPAYVEARLREVDELNYGGKYVEDEEHGSGRSHGIAVHRLSRRVILEIPICLLADTRHRSESYTLQCLVSLLRNAKPIKLNKQEQRHKPMTAKYPKNTSVLQLLNQHESDK
jgi:hypothetical protein